VQQALTPVVCRRDSPQLAWPFSNAVDAIKPCPIRPRRGGKKCPPPSRGRMLGGGHLSIRHGTRSRRQKRRERDLALSDRLLSQEMSPRRERGRLSSVLTPTTSLPGLDVRRPVACTSATPLRSRRSHAEMSRVAASGGGSPTTPYGAQTGGTCSSVDYRGPRGPAPRRPEVPQGPSFFQFADTARMKALLEGRASAIPVQLVAFTAQFDSPRALPTYSSKGRSGRRRFSVAQTTRRGERTSKR